LKAVGEKKQITCEGKPIKITADFSMKTLKQKEYRVSNPRILYPAKLSLKIDGAIKIFHDKHKLKHNMTTKPLLQKIFQEILPTQSVSE
jgi:hypothetical protein